MKVIEIVGKGQAPAAATSARRHTWKKCQSNRQEHPTFFPNFWNARMLSQGVLLGDKAHNGIVALFEVFVFVLKWLCCGASRVTL